MGNTRVDFVKDLLYSVVPEIANVTRGILIIPLVTKVISEEAYGVWMQASVTLMLLAVVVRMNLGLATNRFLSKATADEVRDDFYSLLAITIAFSVTILLLLATFSDTASLLMFNTAKYEGVVVFVGVTLVFATITDQSMQLFRSQRWIKLKSAVQSSRLLLEVGAVGIAALATQSIEAVVAALAIANVLMAIVSVGATVHLTGFAVPRFTRMREYIQYGVPLLPANISHWLVNLSDRYVITYLIGLEAVGGYSVLYGVSMLIMELSNPLVNVLFPDISRLLQEGSVDELSFRVTEAIKYYLILAIPAAVGLSVLGEHIIRIISTATVAMDAQILWLLSSAMILQGLFSVMNTVLNSFDLTKQVGGLWTLVSVSNLGLNLLLVPIYGIAGAALATLVGFVIGAGGIYYISPVSIDIPPSKVAKILFSSLSMGLVVWFALGALTGPVGLIQTLSLVLLGVVAYFVLAAVLGIVGRNEVSLVRSALE